MQTGAPTLLDPNSGPLQPGDIIRVGAHQVFIERHLAEGGFAHVYIARLGPEAVVLKRLACAREDADSLRSFQQEVAIMKKMNGHKHIVRYFDSQVVPYAAQGIQGNVMYILMEYCSRGHLVDYMNARLSTRLPEREILSIFGSVAEAVAHMHYLNPPILHRDIKVENVLIDANGNFKLCDFGSATTRLIPPNTQLSARDINMLEEEVGKFTTLQYRPPELCDFYQRKGMTEKVDIWALGILLYKLCFYTTPFENESSSLAILNGRYTIPRSPSYSQQLISMIQSMLNLDPNKRPNIYAVVAETCRLRNVQCPIKNMYPDLFATSVQPTASMEPKVGGLHKDAALPPVPSSSHPTPAITTTPSLPNMYSTVPPEHVASSITPMRRGRPTKGAAQPISVATPTTTISHNQQPSFTSFASSTSSANTSNMELAAFETSTSNPASSNNTFTTAPNSSIGAFAVDPFAFITPASVPVSASVNAFGEGVLITPQQEINSFQPSNVDAFELISKRDSVGSINGQ